MILNPDTLFFFLVGNTFLKLCPHQDSCILPIVSGLLTILCLCLSPWLSISYFNMQSKSFRIQNFHPSMCITSFYFHLFRCWLPLLPVPLLFPYSLAALSCLSMCGWTNVEKNALRCLYTVFSTYLTKFSLYITLVWEGFRVMWPSGSQRKLSSVQM